MAVLLAGCVTNPSAPDDRVSEQAVSQQATTNVAQKRAKVHTELGSLYLQNGRYGVALDEARTAIAADSGYAPSYNLLGLIHMELKENSAAEENFRKALDMAPGDPEINNNFGLFLCQTNREKQAVDYFQAAIRNPLYTTPAKPLTNLALCYLRMKDDRQAEDFFSRALKSDNRNVQALFWLGDIQFRQGRYNEARLSLAELHRIMDPNSQSLWLALRVERKLGDREAEARYSSQLRRKFHDTPEYQLLMQGQFE
jgi:type IV pilus assembly protein PilF